jgi:uncharacterized protein with von Willebrand factor type A (vWA) domain
MTSMFHSVILILDESGSMSDLKENTVKMVNDFISNQRDKNPTAVLSLYLFNSTTRSIYQSINIQNVPFFTNYFPHGPTALYDAVGDIIAHYQHATNATVFIITDGQDNASHLYSEKNIAHLVTAMRKEKGWQFIFFGADDDITQMGQHMCMDTCYTFNATPDGIDELSQCMSSLVLSSATTTK